MTETNENKILLVYSFHVASTIVFNKTIKKDAHYKCYLNKIIKTNIVIFNSPILT